MLGLLCSRVAQPSVALSTTPIVLRRALHASGRKLQEAQRAQRPQEPRQPHPHPQSRQSSQQPPASQQIQPKENKSHLILQLEKYKLPTDESPQNIQLLKVHDMMREAERLLKIESFEKAESNLIAIVDYMSTHKIEDEWLLGKAFANLGFALQQNNKYEQAMANYGFGLKKLMEAGPSKEPHFVGMRLLTFAELFSLSGMNDGAVQTCQNAVQQLEAAHGNADTFVGLALNNLASFLLIAQKPKEALPHAERAFQILSTTMGKHNATTRNCAVNLASIYKALQKKDELSDLDDAFMAEDAPLLKAKPGQFDQAYIASLKEKWYKQGPRAIFDPPGLHRSAALAARSYTAFLQEWTAKYPLTPTHASVVIPELHSLQYTHDKLPKYEVPKLQNAQGERSRLKPKKWRYDFERDVDKKLATPPSMGKLLEQEAALVRDRIETPYTKDEITISDEEWESLGERQAEYRKKHGDAMREAEEDEFIRSENDYSVAAARKGHVIDEKIVEQEEEEDETEDWDGDTYDMHKAIMGTPEEQAFERSKNKDTPEGAGVDPEEIYMEREAKLEAEVRAAIEKHGVAPPDPDNLTIDDPDYEYELEGEEGESEEAGDARMEELDQKLEAQFTQKMKTAVRDMSDLTDIEEHFDEDNVSLEGQIDTHPSLNFDELRSLGPLSPEMQEQYDDDIDPSSPFWEGRQPTGPIGAGPSAPAESGKANEFEKGQSGAYAHNPEEDDVFPEPQKGKTTYSPEEGLSDREVLKRRRPEHKYGRLHEVPWHDDFK